MGEVLAVVALVLAVPPVIEEIVRLGKDVARRVDLCKGTPGTLTGLAVFSDEGMKTKMRLNLGHKICQSPDPSIDEEIRTHLDKKFQDIQRTINEASLLVTKLEKGGFRNFWKLNDLRREVEGCVRSLRESINSFNDTINLVHLEQGGPPYASLDSDVFKYRLETQKPISDVSCIVRGHLAQDRNKISAKKGDFLLEMRPYKRVTKESLERALAYLAQTLIDANVSESMLRAAGYVDDPGNSRFFLVFDIPNILVPAGSLQTILQSLPYVPALNIRVALCNKLANAIFEVHNLRLVHKNINSASVLVMTPEGNTMSTVTDQDLRTFLLNWQLVRKVDAASIPFPERKWWKGIYQHPGRQIALTEDEYTMGHDIYSLGVCMLEILLWKPLVQFAAGEEPTVNPIFTEHAVALRIIENTYESLQSFLDEPDDPRDIQKVLLDIADKQLPAAVGRRLSSLITSCLKCLEGGFGQLSFQLGTGRVEVGMNYITSVKASFQEICI